MELRADRLCFQSAMKDLPDYLILAAVLTWFLFAALLTALFDKRKLTAAPAASRRRRTGRR
jgi:hypothetical protein